MNDLITVEELSILIDKDECLVFDCRFSLMDSLAGETAYKESHIPSARYANLNKDLSSSHFVGKTGRHPLPDKETWIAKVQSWGINPSSKIVVYDDMGGAFAARMWWLMRWIGHSNVAVLDGGWHAWLNSGAEVSSAIPSELTPSNYDYAALASLCKTISVDEIDSTEQLLIDAREEKRFRGEIEPIDPIAGHIPGAFCSPMSANLNESGCFKSEAELREKFSLLVDADKPVVSYCGSGVTAIHNILAARLAGIEEPILYPGSWSEWIVDPSRPVATDE